MTKPWQVGDLVQNRWEIHRILQGGMGAVYIVYDFVAREARAAKTYRDEVFAQDPAIAERFKQEARAWVNLDAHPNVTRATAVQVIDGKPFLFLEYVSGGDLGSWIGTPRLTEDLPQVLDFAIQFCDGMEHALGKGIRAHLDIKPENCLLTEDGTLKVTDFGVARLFDVVESAAVVPRGTYTHMAPEQFDSAAAPDARADIYSFGVMLYEMATGRLPFPAETWEEAARRHTSASPPMLEGHLAALNDVVQTCLAKEPARRFASFLNVRRRLAEIRELLTGQPATPPVEGAELNALQYVDKGACLQTLNHHEEALACFDRALALNPNDTLAWTHKGHALDQLGRGREALPCFDRAIELNPHSALAWLRRGHALAHTGPAEKALRCFERSLEFNPHSDLAWAGQARVFARIGRRDEEVT